MPLPSPVSVAGWVADTGHGGETLQPMALKNYTTSIAIEKTLGQIQAMLVKAGANAILNEYDDEGYIVAVSFKIRLEEQDVMFRLPSDWRPVLAILQNDRNVARRLCTQEQALRTAWRIIYHWVDAQLAIIETKMVKTEQVFLPYAIGKDGKTVYESVLEGKLLLE